MYVRLSIPDIAALTSIGVTSWFLAGHTVTWGMWVAYGAYAAGRLVQWIIGNNS